MWSTGCSNMKRQKKDIKQEMKELREQIYERKKGRKGSEIHRNDRKEGTTDSVDRSITRYSVAAMVISSGGLAVINEWINRGSVERQCIDDTRESSVVSFTREIQASRGEQRTTFVKFNGEFAHRTAHVTAFQSNRLVSWSTSRRTTGRTIYKVVNFVPFLK